MHEKKPKNSSGKKHKKSVESEKSIYISSIIVNHAADLQHS
jgi:hypothetical protein